MLISHRVLAALLVTLAACSGSAALDPNTPLVTASLGDEFELPFGQTAAISDTPIQMRFIGVTEDSRCPIDVVCVWQGNARVVLYVRAGAAGDEAIILDSGVEPHSAVVGEYRIAYVALQPAPRAGESIPERRYVIRLHVTRE